MWNKIKCWLLLSIDPEEPFIYGVLLIVVIVGTAYIAVKYPVGTPNDDLQNQRIEQLERRIELLEHGKR